MFYICICICRNTQVRYAYVFADKPNIMDELTNNIKNIENNIAKYIYKKYIIKNVNIQPISNITNQNINLNTVNNIRTRSDVIIAHKNTKILEHKLYTIYLNKIFNISRTTFRINQEDIIKEDLKKMANSDKAYIFNPSAFKPTEYDILPNILRCNYIRTYKHRYYRCLKKKITNNNDNNNNNNNYNDNDNENDDDDDDDDDDNNNDDNKNNNDDDDDNDDDNKFCMIHDNCNNINLNAYNELIKKYTKSNNIINVIDKNVIHAS